MFKRIPHENNAMFSSVDAAKKYLEMQKKFGTRYLEEFLQIMKELNKKGKYLEAGPGPGYVTSLVAREFHPESITGLEYSPDMISIAEEYTGETVRGVKINFVPGVVEDPLAFNSLGKFDLIYTTYSMHHWENVKAGVGNLYNALDENGVLFIFDYFRNGFFYYFKLKRRVRESIRASFRRPEIEQIIKELGIKKYKITYHGVYLFIVVYK